MLSAAKILGPAFAAFMMRRSLCLPPFTGLGACIVNILIVGLLLDIRKQATLRHQVSGGVPGEYSNTE